MQLRELLMHHSFNDLNNEAATFISNNGGMDQSLRVNKYWKWNKDKILQLPLHYQPPALDQSEFEFVRFKSQVRITG